MCVYVWFFLCVYVFVCAGGGKPEDPDVFQSGVTDLEVVCLPALLLDQKWGPLEEQLLLFIAELALSPGLCTPFQTIQIFTF